MQAFYFLLCALMKIKHPELPDIQGPEKVIVLSFNKIRMHQTSSISVQHMFASSVTRLGLKWSEIIGINHILVHFSYNTNDCTLESHLIFHPYETRVM